MSEIGKPKFKNNYYKRNQNRRSIGVDINQKGFLCSCNNREKDCIRESYNLLNKFADKLYPAVSDLQDAGKSEKAEEEIDESLAKELATLKQENRPDKKKFQAVDSGAKNLLFIRTTLEDPVELAAAIVKDIEENRNQQTKTLLRLVPIEITCKAYIADVEKAFDTVAQKHFKDAPKSFSIQYNHRNNNSLARDDVIKLLADKVIAIRSDHKVDLKGAEVSIVVEVIRGFVFIGIIQDYLKYKKYNLLSLCGGEGAEGETEKMADDQNN